jgi:hypothetical protein
MPNAPDANRQLRRPAASRWRLGGASAFWSTTCTLLTASAVKFRSCDISNFQCPKTTPFWTSAEQSGRAAVLRGSLWICSCRSELTLSPVRPIRPKPSVYCYLHGSSSFPHYPSSAREAQSCDTSTRGIRAIAASRTRLWLACRSGCQDRHLSRG